jgi:putative ABC transport system permease protein
MFHDFARDLRFALRTAARNAGFTAVVVATLGIGIGANTAIFSVVDAVLLRPLPFPESDRLVAVWADYTRRDGPLREWLSYPNFADLRDESNAFRSVGAYGGWFPTVTGLGEPEQLTGAQMSAGTFSDVLGVPAALGRTLQPADDLPGADNTVVVSHGFWTRAFGADPNILGTAMTLNAMPYTVIGVMPRGFRPPFFPNADVWSANRVDLTQEFRGSASWRSIGRLADGVSIETARDRAEVVGSRLESEYPEDNTGVGYAVFPLQEDLVRTAQTALWVLLGAVTFVLLVACVNVVNLLLARTTARRSELAVRAALGAGGTRIARQVLTESAVLAVMGGVVGIGLAFLGTDLIVSMAPPGTPRIDDVAVDGRVLGFTAVLSIVVGIVFGVIPALRAAGSDVHEALKEGGRGSDLGSRGGRMRSMLVTGQVALALILLVGAGLFVRSLTRLNAVDPGFDPSGKLTAQIILPPSRYPDGAARTNFFVELEQRVAALPGVERVSATNTIPLTGNDSDANFHVEGQPLPRAGDEPAAWIRRVTPSYFETMDIALREGRAFAQSDDPEAPLVVIINETIAERYFPDRSPIGQRVTFGNPTQDPTWREIVGVASNVKNFGIRSDSRFAIYFPYKQVPSGFMALVVQTAGDPEALAPSLRRTVSGMDPALAVANVTTMESIVGDSLGSDRFNATLLSLFAGVALILAAVGLYGVVSYGVNQRQAEMGVRIALGAAGRDIRRLIIGRSLILVGVGLTIGAAGALALSRVVDGLLFEVSLADPAIFLTTALVLSAVAVVASGIPAVRASRIDPIRVLKSE